MNASTEQLIYECSAENRLKFVLEKTLDDNKTIPQSIPCLIEQLQLVQKLNNMEKGIIPDMNAFSDLIRAFDVGNRINMIKSLRAMFNTSLADTCVEINRVFITTDLLLKVTYWEFKGVKLGEMAQGKDGLEWKWNL